MSSAPFGARLSKALQGLVLRALKARALSVVFASLISFGVSRLASTSSFGIRPSYFNALRPSLRFFLIERVAPHGIKQRAVGRKFPVVVHCHHAYNKHHRHTQNEGERVRATKRHEKLE